MFDSLHFNPQTGLARYNDLFTVMLLCMIPPGLDSSITAVSVRFFLIEASLIDSPWTQQSQEPF